MARSYWAIFASPLNRHPLNAFCSAFPDTDAPFGSVGNFFSAAPRSLALGSSRSAEAGPPYEDELIDAQGIWKMYRPTFPMWPNIICQTRRLEH